MQPKVKMTNITIKNIPESLYNKIKESSVINRRSINAEIIFQLEHGLESPKRQRLSLDKIRSLRANTQKHYLTQSELSDVLIRGRKW